MKLVLFVGVVFIGLSPFIGLTNMSIEGILLAGVVLVFVAKWEQLSEVSFGPLQAKMKKKIAQTEAILDKLQNLALTTTEATLTDLIAGEFCTSMKLSKRIELHDKLVQTLREVGVSSERIIQVEKDWQKGISVIYFDEIYWRVAGRTNRYHSVPKDGVKVPENQIKATRELEGLKDDFNWIVPSHKKIREILRKNSVSIIEVEQLVDDYEYFLNSGEPRNLVKVRDEQH